MTLKAAGTGLDLEMLTGQEHVAQPTRSRVHAECGALETGEKARSPVEPGDHPGPANAGQPQVVVAKCPGKGFGPAHGSGYLEQLLLPCGHRCQEVTARGPLPLTSTVGPTLCSLSLPAPCLLPLLA